MVKGERQNTGDRRQNTGKRQGIIRSGLDRAQPRRRGEELFGLTSQMRRPAVSVPANIAEGFKIKSRADKARSLNMPQASLKEVRYYLILTNDLGYAETKDLMTALEEVLRNLNSRMKSVERI